MTSVQMSRDRLREALDAELKKQLGVPALSNAYV
jgi:hypothetical protein